MNYFESENAATRYSQGRPYFHGESLLRVKTYLKLSTKVNKALDIACGTGLSTTALLNIAEQVYGTDTSAEMLKWALNKEQINYSLAPAEMQPFPNNEFNLITVASGVHWFNIDTFLKEANRLLKPQAWLILYDNFFISEMQGCEEFSHWYPQVFLKKFPAPKRNNTYDWSQANVSGHNFILVKEEEFKNAVLFTKEELVMYLTTQSNVTAQTDSEQLTYAEVEQWLNQELNPYYGMEATRTLYFGNWIKYLCKSI